jgi:porphyrinogen peroxidase
MFIGRPPGNYDRLLDFSRAVTGNLFFTPSATFLENVGEEDSSTAPSSVAEASVSASKGDGSLSIGSLKGESTDE